jgi:glutaredoxin
VIFLLSSVPGRNLSGPIPDYVAHGAEYFVLGTLLLRALNGGIRPPAGIARCLQMAILCVAWGALDEAHQSFVPGRDATPVDVAYDAGGAILAAMAFPLWRRLPGVRASGRNRGSLLLLERRECPLCAAAWTTLERLVPGHDVDCRRVDVDAQPELATEWGEEVPVIMLNGEALCRGRVDERVLRRRLAPFRSPDARG